MLSGTCNYPAFFCFVCTDSTLWRSSIEQWFLMRKAAYTYTERTHLFHLKWVYVGGSAKANERWWMSSFAFGSILSNVGNWPNVKGCLFDTNDLFARIRHVWTLMCIHICTRTQTRQAEARHTRTYALIATRGKMLSFAEPVKDSLWSTDSRWIAFVRPQTKQRQFSSPQLHVYIATHASPRPASRAFLF